MTVPGSSSSSVLWQPVALAAGQQQVVFDQPIDNDEFDARCAKVEQLVWLQSHKYNHRLAAVSTVDNDSDESYRLWQRFTSVYPHLAQLDLAHCQHKIRLLIPKRPDKHTDDYFELLLIDVNAAVEGEHVYEFYPLEIESIGPSTPYAWAITNRWSSEQPNRIDISAGVLSDKPIEAGALDFLHKKVVALWTHWLRTVDPSKDTVQSHRLVDPLHYTHTYCSLKHTHGTRIAQNWPEKTRAEKFVFEDVAIASYLSSLWAQPECSSAAAADKPVNFCDLGCGNGLLVYLLNRLGHSGSGIDLRSRAIWGWYDKEIDLLATTINPSATKPQLPAGTNWLIGNHSDELTPWIPVMAVRLGVNYLVLPCCAHDFYAKYHKTAAGSTYSSYLSYVKHIGQRLGYDVEQDRLRIPSTKRVCFVGRLPPTEGRLSAEQVEERVAELLSAARARAGKAGGSSNGHTDVEFQARPAVEPVRNCTGIDRGKRVELLRLFMNLVLSGSDAHRPPAEVDLGEMMLGAAATTDQNGNDLCKQTAAAAADGDGVWRAGGSLPVAKCVAQLTDEQKQHLKQQCGGLKTFFRNHQYIFSLFNDTNHQLCVRLRDYRANPPKTFSKPCWFYSEHPDKCALRDGCPLKHEESQFSYV